MRSVHILPRLPWLVCLVGGCGDDLAGASGVGAGSGGISGSGSDGATTSTPSHTDSSGASGVGKTSYADTTGTPDTTDTPDTASDSGTTGQPSTTGDSGTTGDVDTETNGDTEVGAAPIAVDDVAFTAQNSALDLDAAGGLLGNDTDPDGDPLTVTDFDAVSVGGGSVFVGDDGAVFYQPAAGFWGTDSFTYTVKDDTGASATATVTVHVAPRQIPLAAVAGGMGGFSISGEFEGNSSGGSVSGAGDVNGDGLEDIIVGARGADPNGDGSGRAYVVFGKANTNAVALSDITQGHGGFVLNGEFEGDRAGASVSGAGDVNGDGMDDLIVGAIYADINGTSSGRSYVVFGKADTDAVELTSIAAGSGGFVLNGAWSDRAGYWVNPTGDLNGDGLDDLFVGAGGDSRSYVVFGKLDTAAVELSAIASGIGGFALEGEADSFYSGWSGSGAGDVNADGFNDIILGDRGADPSGYHSGRSYVVFGKADTTAVDLSAVTAGTGGFAINGEGHSEFSGWAVSGIGDLNGDDLADVLVGACGSDFGGQNTGRSYVVFGKADGSLVELSSIAAGVGGFVLNGAAIVNGFSGRSVSSAGDVNADGVNDIIIGANGGGQPGQSYVVFGKADTAPVDLGAISNGPGGYVLSGEAPGDYAGISVSDAGDVNGDGTADVIIGARRADPNGMSSGKSYVVFGVPTGET